VLQTLLGHPPLLPKGTPAPAAERVIDQIIAVQSKYWKSLTS